MPEAVKEAVKTEKKETWLNYLALTTVLLAVCATFSASKGGGCSTRSVLSQAEASDHWAQYQSKSIKSYLYEMQQKDLELKVASLQAQPQPPQSVIDQYQKRITTCSQEITRYDQEKKEISAKARKAEAKRDDAQKHGAQFGSAVNFLQIAILLCSISGLMKKKPLWLLGVVIGLAGVYYFLTGFFMPAIV